MEYSSLQGFARFLLDEQLDEFTTLNIQRAREVQLPLLKLFSHLSPQELFAYSRQSVATWLIDILEGRAFQTHQASLLRWKQDLLPEISRQSVNGIDLTFSPHTRKFALYQLLGKYASTVENYQAIVQQIEEFYTRCQAASLQAFMDVQQEVLQQEKDLLQTIIDTTEEGMLALDRELKVTLWNGALERRTGLQSEALLGKAIFELFPKNDQGNEEKAILQALQGEKVFLQNQPIRYRPGFYDMQVVPLLDRQGATIGILSVSRDVTEQKQAAEALQASHEEISAQQEEMAAANLEMQEHLARLEETQQSLSESEARLKEAQATAHLGHYIYEEGRQYLYWSEEMKAIFGIDPSFARLANEGYFSLIHPQDRPLAQQEMEKAMQNGGFFSLEHRILRADESIRWVLLQGKAIPAVEGSGLRMSGTCLDITERKEAELLVQSEQYFIRRLTDTSPDVITLYDLEQGLNLYSSREIYSLLGYSEEELAHIQQRGQAAFVDYFHPDDVPIILSFLDSYKTYRDEAPREMEYRIKNAKGEWMYINDRYSVFRRNEQGLPIQIIGVARNVTDRKKAEQEIERKSQQLQEAYEEMAAAQEELRQTNEELSKVNTELEYRINERTQELAQALAESRQQNQVLLRTNTDLDNFVYTASHDLKAPIANLEGITTLLTKKLADRLNEKEAELMAMVNKMTGRLKATISDLTEITKVQKHLDETVEAVSFAQVLADVSADLQPLLEQTTAQITTSWQVPGITYARKHVRSILYNLLSNALKYCSPERSPHIRIESLCHQEYTLLLVSDNGLGIAAHQQHKLFKMFKRLHSHGEGSGIGLYITKRIIENQGGSIEVESQEGIGTTFKVYLLTQNRQS